jgi:hypothetical protein
MKTHTNGATQSIDIVYIRGSQIQFIVLPEMLAKAPFFNRIKMWRKFKGHAIFGGGALIGPVRGQSAAIIQKSQARRLLVQGPPAAGGAGAPMMSRPPMSYPPGGAGYLPPGGGYPPSNGGYPPQSYGGGGGGPGYPAPYR